LDRSRRPDDLAVDDPNTAQLATVPQTQDNDPVEDVPAVVEVWR